MLSTPTILLLIRRSTLEEGEVVRVLQIIPPPLYTPYGDSFRELKFSSSQPTLVRVGP